MCVYVCAALLKTVSVMLPFVYGSALYTWIWTQPVPLEQLSFSLFRHTDFCHCVFWHMYMYMYTIDLWICISLKVGKLRIDALINSMYHTYKTVTSWELQKKQAAYIHVYIVYTCVFAYIVYTCIFAYFTYIYIHVGPIVMTLCPPCKGWQ